MTRDEQRSINQKAIFRAVEIINQKICQHWRRPPSYRAVTEQLNREGLRSSRGHNWNMKTFYLMLARHGYRGIYGLNQAYLVGTFDDQLSSISTSQLTNKT